ncbi:phosphate uptake regulator PhoU [Vulcanisaeta thermophila]|uniref:phosphate uptake regulator PhoU n=1 Tax=Vulcanisaeta thermophila TaxID=867917 RepID=UPI000853E229|nr:phosphate uptake regulator PhoU [Vulcanisaeta thermophila]
MVEQEIRKLQILGRSSLGITLPKRWVDAMGLRPGSPVLIQLMGNYMVVTPLNMAVNTGLGTGVTITIERGDPDYALRRLITHYLRGIDQVKLVFGKFTAIKPAVKELIRDRISGAEVIEEGGDYLVIKFIMPSPEIPIKRLLNRMALVVLGMIDDALALFRGDGDVEEIVERDNEVDRLYLLMARLVMMGLVDQTILSKLEVENSRELVNSLMVAKSLERAGDHAWRAANFIHEVRKLCCAENPSFVDHLVEMGRSSAELLRTSAFSFINRNLDDALSVLDRRKYMRVKSMEIIKDIYGSGLHVDVGGRLMMIIESFRRISEYSYDIAEITLDTYFDITR